MTITIARDVVSRIRNQPDNIILMVEGASDADLAAEALRSAAREIGALDGGWRSAWGLRPGDRNDPKYVSEVLPTAAGPFVMIDGGSVPAKLLRTIPDIVARHLEATGVSEARVACPREGGVLTDLFDGGRLPRAVQLVLYPTPPRRWREYGAIPDEWLPEAAAWVAAESTAGGLLHARVIVNEFSLGAGDVEGFLRRAAEARSHILQVVGGRLGTNMRVIAGEFSTFVPRLALGAGGPEATDSDILAAFEALVGVGRRLAPSVAYGVVSVDSTFGCLTHCMPGSDPSSPWDPLDTGLAALLIDEYVPDAFAYQILGPGHLTRLGKPPPGAMTLGGDRAELFVGKVGDWLIDLPDDWNDRPLSDAYDDAPRRSPGVRRSAYDALGPCLVPRGEVSRRRLVEDRLGLPEGSVGDPEHPKETP